MLDSQKSNTKPLSKMVKTLAPIVKMVVIGCNSISTQRIGLYKLLAKKLKIIRRINHDYSG